MTGLEGNREIYFPREIQDRLPKSFYYPEGPVIICFIIHYFTQRKK